MTPKRLAASVEIYVTGSIAVFYFGRLIALVNDRGLIIWRDLNYPIFLVNYLIEYPPPQHQWN